MTQRASKRILQGVAAQGFGLFARLVTQLASLPVLFHYWSTDRVGAWMTLFALPQYFMLIGGSFAGAGGSAAMAAVRENDWRRARAFSRASWFLGSALTAAFLAIGLAVALMASARFAAAYDFPSDVELVPVVAGLAVYVLAVAQMYAIGLIFRIARRYPLHTLAMALAGLVDVAILIACAAHSNSLGVAAWGLAMGRIASALATYLLARRVEPAMFEGKAEPVRSVAGELWRPTLALTSVPVTLAINLQGFTLLVGAIAGAAALAAFVATRTLVRLIDQLMAVMFSLQFYEAGYVDTAKVDIPRRQLATMTVATIAIMVVAALFLFALGAPLQRALSSGKTAFDPAVAAILLVSGAIRGLATTPNAYLFAHNRHTGATTLYFLGTIACFAAATVAAQLGAPLLIVLLFLVPAELFGTYPSFDRTLRELGWSWPAFLRSLISSERIDDLKRVARAVRRPA